MNRSESIAKLAIALVKFNSEVNKISKDADNPFFKNSYATLDTIIDEVRPLLSQNGLSIMQIPSGDGQNVTLKTLLIHESGEFLESDELTMKPVKNDPQAVGSCITYARRYSLAAFLSLNTGEDDDGNKATYGANKPNQNKQDQTGNNSGFKPLSDKQKGMINANITKLTELTGHDRDTIKGSLMNKEDIGPFNSVAEMSVSQASKAIGYLQQWVKANGGE